MTTALIFAGGTGIRMNTAKKPKQFLELHGKPILIYTIEHFEFHNEVDEIVVVCLENWIKELRRFLRLYEITKVSKIVAGNPEGGDYSIYNGLKAMEEMHKFDDIVLIHDGVRPLINAELISENIAKVKEFGNAITCEPVVESVIRSVDGKTVGDVPSRWEMYSAKAPQSFRYGEIYELYKRAKSDGFRAIDSANLCSHYGTKMNIVKSSTNNIKITKPQDFYIFRALYEAMENEQILGI
ncbi:IspD/TarI family cytidylyltransferase [Anaerocolumna sp. MB42-C2]|uniref:IspD/TarI family cytidylyltransferase n=1 Tax=Anaerocolumna sp. MB42-C2 TaxID=3070997 RepID=UPI0027E011DC|nr:IspD/TarI family cytidylyltransferase [Anaerocolumna sp. MB42-C2]WMJ90205.1 IspD/TarI family cytidylyltransferase [Anaerocolumna sp. MB42-C2]